MVVQLHYLSVFPALLTKSLHVLHDVDNVVVGHVNAGSEVKSVGAKQHEHCFVVNSDPFVAFYIPMQLH